MNRLIPMQSKEDIPSSYRDNPIGLLIQYHNFERSYDVYSDPKLLVGMCMDNRKRLRIPDNFTYILRSGGANLNYSGFKVSYAIFIGGVRHIAVIGHTQCGMVDLMSRKEQFIQGLVEGAGWERFVAQKHFDESVPEFEIVNEIDFILDQVERLKKKYPKIFIVPLIYRVEDNLLYGIKANESKNR